MIPAKPVVTNARAFYTPRAATGAAGTRRFLRPLFSRDRFPAQLGRIAPREREAVSRRHCERQRSNPFFLSVAKWNRFADARNDEWGRVHGCLKFESERMIEPWLARRPKPPNGEVRLRSRFARLRRTRIALAVLRGSATRSPQNGEVRLRSRFARLRRTRIALAVLRGCATRSPQGRSVVPLAGIEPALLAELDFESSASTNSATGASHDVRLRASVAKPAEYSWPRLPVNPRAAGFGRRAGAPFDPRSRSPPSAGKRRR